MGVIMHIENKTNDNEHEKRHCGKAAFRSRSHARSLLKSKKVGKGFRARAYECPKCRMWHLTNDDKSSWMRRKPTKQNRKTPKGAYRRKSNGQHDY